MPRRTTPAHARRGRAAARSRASTSCTRSRGSTTTPVARLAERLGAAPGAAALLGHRRARCPTCSPPRRPGRSGRATSTSRCITGAEALATVRRLKKAGERPQWSYKPAEKRPFPMDMEFDPSEISHAVFEAYLTFALFDNARRAHLGRGLDEHRDALGRIMAPMTEVAARQPARLVPRGAQRRRDRHADRRQPHGGLPVHEADDGDHGRRHGGRPRAGQRREGRRAGGARGAAGLPARLGLRRGPRPRGRPSRAVALPRHGRRGRGPRWRVRASASTTWPTSTSTRASPAPVCFALDALGIAEDDRRAPR